MTTPSASARSTEKIPVRTALISVSDKNGLIPFAKGLAEAGVDLVSTGGTAQALREAGLTVRDVAEVTGFPEMMDGRVKTLHPAIHGGLLALRGNPEHEAALEQHGIKPIDLLVVNLYPFEETVARAEVSGEGSASREECIENIDIGGPAMIRAGAKNHAAVTVVVDADDYPTVLAEIANGGVTAATRERLAAIAWARIAAYDASVAKWMQAEMPGATVEGEETPRRRAFAGQLVNALRYGENPHQGAAYYNDGTGRAGVAFAVQLQGKALGYNNIADADAAFECVSELEERPAVAIIKHANPCGVAEGETLADAYGRAFDCDRVSAFGGIVALNRAVDRATAEAIAKVFTEVVIAPDADQTAREVLEQRKDLRLLLTGDLPDPSSPHLHWKQVAGGFLVQDADTGRIGVDDLKIVTKRKPSDREVEDCLFAWRVAKHVKSNAVVFAKEGATVGIGAGQMSRVDSTWIAVRKAADMAKELGLKEPATKGAVAASDAFFPFADGLMAIAEAGATAVIQPGGSIRDEEVIAAADEAGLAMIFTGMRHFRH